MYVLKVVTISTNTFRFQYTSFVSSRTRLSLDSLRCKSVYLEMVDVKAVIQKYSTQVTQDEEHSEDTNVMFLSIFIFLFIDLVGFLLLFFVFSIGFYLFSSFSLVFSFLENIIRVQNKFQS